MSAYLWDPLTKDCLGPDSEQAAGFSSHTDKTVEDKGTGEKGRGDGEKLEGCNIITGREGGIKIF